MADCNEPTQVCVLKVELPCCEACPGKVNKKLLEIQGVQGIHTDTEEGVVIVTGLLDPAIITQTIGKLGVEAELLAYEKDPKRAKKKLDHFLKGHSKDNKRNLEENNDRVHDRGWYEYDAGCVMPSCTSRRHPNYGMRRVRPGFPRPNYVHPINQPVIYNRPPPPPPRYVRWTRPPLPYPFSIYEQQEQDVGNAPHHILSDENVSVCSVM